MQNEFIPYEQALALKELGFDEPCLMYYDYSWTLVESGVYECKAPLYQQAFRFFREKYGLFAEIKPYLIIGTEWRYTITNRNNSSGLPYEEEFETYEKAELVCLIKLIEIVKNQTKN